MTALALKQPPAADPFQEDFSANATNLPGAGLAWLDELRSRAIEAFASTGIPSRRVEAWKYTDLAAALDAPLQPAKRFEGTIDEQGVSLQAEHHLTLINGFLQAQSADLSASGIEVVDLSEISSATPHWVRQNLGRLASGADQPLGAASLALMRGGVALRVRAPSASLHLSFVNPRKHEYVSHTRILVLVDEGCSLRLTESHVGGGSDKSLTNLGFEFVLSAGAKLDHVQLQAEAASALHIGSLGVKIERDARYRALITALGANVSRLDAVVQLRGEGAEAQLHSVAAIRSGIADVTTVMDHASPHTTSRQLFKSVVGGRGRSVNQGRVVVREGAVKSDSHQLFKALLLSPRAEADAKPELEIFADDVACGHGTAIGALDEDALFYLRARGIPKAEAKSVLIRAFLDDAIEGFVDESTHDALWQRLDAALSAIGQDPK